MKFCGNQLYATSTVALSLTYWTWNNPLFCCGNKFLIFIEFQWTLQRNVIWLYHLKSDVRRRKFSEMYMYIHLLCRSETL